MNRPLLVLNAFLALVLVIRMATLGGTPVVAGERGAPLSAAWTAADLRIVPTDFVGRRLHQFVLDLGRDVAPELMRPSGGGGSAGDWRPAAELGLHLEPKAELLAAFRSSRQIALAVPAGLPGGRAFHVHVGSVLRAADSSQLPGNTVVTSDTGNVALTRATLEEPLEAAGGEVSLLLTWDLPVDMEALRSRLEVRRRDQSAPVPFRLESLPADEGSRFRVVPQLDAAASAIAVHIAPGLKPLGGDVGTPRELVQHFNLAEPLALHGAGWRDGGIDLGFNRTVALPAEGSIELEPAQPFQAFRQNGGLRITGSFAPGAVVAVKLKAGFPAVGADALVPDRRRLAAEVRHSLLVPDLPATLDFAQPGRVLSLRAEPVLEVRGVNVAAFTVRARRVYPNNAVRMAQDGDAEAMAPAVERRVTVTAARNQEFVERIDLAKLLGATARGLYRIELQHEDRWWPEHRLLQLTDLGVSVRAAADAAAVQVVSIADGQAVSGARVQVLSPTNQVLAQGETDGRGVLLLRWSGGADDRRPFLVSATTADDQSFVDLPGFAVELADPTLGGRPFAGELPEAYVWPTRGIVRPGETIDVAVLVRQPDGGAVAGRTVTALFEAPNGRAFRRQRVVLPGSGLARVELRTGTDLPVGTWQVRLLDGAAGSDGDGDELGRAPVQVEAFVPYRLEAEVAARREFRFGQPAEVLVRGRWLDGTPAAGRPVTVRMQLTTGTFAPAGSDGFVFASSDEQPPPGEQPSVSAVLDERGEAVVRLMLPPDAPQQTLTARLLAEVEDPSGRTVRAAATAPVLRSGLHCGVRSGAAGLELRAVGGDGAPWAAVAPFTVRLERRRWHWRHRSVGVDRWRWETTVQASVLGEWHGELRDGAAAVPLPPAAEDHEGGGWLVAVVTVEGRAIECRLQPAPERPDRLRVTVPADPVAPGATVRVTIDAPASGRGFVTLEADTVLAAEVIELVRGSNQVFLTIPADLRVPNAHVVATMTRPARAVGPELGPAWLIGGTAVMLRRDDVAGDVSLRVPALIAPEAAVTCEVTAPGATAAVVAVVDEGVLAVTEHASPDPVGHLLARRRLHAAGADAFAALMAGLRFLPGTRTGGDGGDELTSMLAVGAISPRIRPLALVADVALDAAGRGVATFTLPAYEGRVRVMVLAAGPRCFGAAASPVVVQAPLGLQAALPRMVAPGDRFDVPVTVRNGSGGDGEVLLAATAEGGLELVDAAPLAVPVAAGATATVFLTVRATTPVAGTTPRLRLHARHDGLERRLDVDLLVRELRLLQEEHHGLSLRPGDSLRLGEEFAAEDLTVRIQVSPTPAPQLRPALQSMVQYPYGCVEQTTSRGFVLLGCAALLDRIQGEEAGAPDATLLTQAAVDRLCGMQHWQGGFGWWGGGAESPFGTVYAADFLLAAREAGFQVPSDVISGCLQRVERILLSTSPLALRAMACEVLARSGAAVRSRALLLADQARDEEERVVLALLLARYGEDAAARALLAAPVAAVVDAAAERRDTVLLRSNLRTRALRLRALLAVDPAGAATAALALALQRELLRPRNLTTQERGQGVRALAEWYRGRVGDGPAALSGTLDGQPLPAPVAGVIELPLRPGAQLQIQEGSQGFALVTVRGFRPVRPTAGDGTLTVERTLIDPTTGEAPTELRTGRVYEVHLRGQAQRPLDQVVLVDLLPGGFEADAPPPWAEPVRRGPGRRGAGPADALIERRDDRVLLFPRDELRGEFHFVHLVRATFAGTYDAPPPMVQAMYDPVATFTGAGADGVEIRR